MNDILIPMSGCRLPSSTGRVVYTVVEVVPGQHVTLDSPNRGRPSVLPWEDIERVYSAACSGRHITPKAVDEILENPNNHHSSTMCALVLAMRDPNRVRR